MHPFMVQWEVPGLGPLDVPSYFLMVMTAFLVGSSLGVREGRRGGYRVIDFLDLSLLILVAGLVGSRLGHIFFESYNITTLDIPASDASWQHAICRWLGEEHPVKGPTMRLSKFYLLHPHMTFAVWNGGMVFYGGFLLLIPAVWIFCKRRKLPFWQIADLSSWSGAVALAFGRIGCLLAGCCHGGKIEGPLAALGIEFTRSLPRELQRVPVWPTQLFETLVALAIGWGLLHMRKVKTFDGQIFLALLVLYGLWRPINEYLRADAQRSVYIGLTTSQWISVFLLVAAAVLFPILYKRRVKPSVGAPAPAQVVPA